MNLRSNISLPFPVRLDSKGMEVGNNLHISLLLSYLVVLIQFKAGFCTFTGFQGWKKYPCYF